jgi:hypothetical protein
MNFPWIKKGKHSNKVYDMKNKKGQKEMQYLMMHAEMLYHPKSPQLGAPHYSKF